MKGAKKLFAFLLVSGMLCSFAFAGCSPGNSEDDPDISSQEVDGALDVGRDMRKGPYHTALKYLIF